MAELGEWRFMFYVLSTQIKGSKTVSHCIAAMQYAMLGSDALPTELFSLQANSKTMYQMFQWRLRKLRRLEMSRCHLNEHAFYELMPVVMRTEHVVLEGNRFFPLEMKIFAR